MEVQNYLKHYGYIPMDAACDPNRLDDQTAQGLMALKRFFGLNETSDLDEPVRELMTQARCGVPDGSPLAFETIGSWPKLDLRYAFGTLSASLGASTVMEAVRRACTTWENAGVGLVFTEVDRGEPHDIFIEWRQANDPDLSMVGGTLAHADFPPGFSIITPQPPLPLHFDDEEHRWVDGAGANAFDIETVALHELGHNLGLLHSNVLGAVMYPTVSSNFTNRQLTNDDLSGIEALYGQLPVG